MLCSGTEVELGLTAVGAVVIGFRTAAFCLFVLFSRTASIPQGYVAPNTDIGNRSWPVPQTTT